MDLRGCRRRNRRAQARGPAASLLAVFRTNCPENPLQPEETKKMAYVYRENNQLSLAAVEYERIERESRDDEIRRDALLVAAELHEKDGNSVRALEVSRRYVGYFPQPVAVGLVQPFEDNLRKKRELMKTATQKFNQLVDYEIGDITAAATFYLAEIYAHFSKALTASERPEGLSPADREQHELAH